MSHLQSRLGEPADSQVAAWAAVVGPFLLWPLLGAVGLSLGFGLLEAVRVLGGASFSFFLSDPAQTLTTYSRLAALVHYGAPDRQLVMPLVGLGAATWLLVTGSPGRRAVDSRDGRVTLTLTALLAAQAGLLAVGIGYLALAPQPRHSSVMYLGPGRLEELGPPLVNVLVVLALAAVLAWLLQRRTALPSGAAGGRGPARATLPAPGPAVWSGPDRRAATSTDGPRHVPPARSAPPDPHEPYRRPAGG